MNDSRPSHTRHRSHGRTRDPHDRASDYSGISTRELTKLLHAHEEEARALERSLAGVHAQINSETERCTVAETRQREVNRRLRSVMDQRRVIDADAARANEELKLYRIQLDAARREIEHAQSILDQVEQDRVRAEEDAAAARDDARKFKEEKMVELAREEGRRLGLAEGLRRGKLAGFAEGRDSMYQEVEGQQAEQDKQAEANKAADEEAQRQRQQAIAQQLEEEDRRREEEARLREEDARIREDEARMREEARIREEARMREEEVRMREEEERMREDEARRREEGDRLRNDQQIHPIIVHNVPPSIHHPHIDVPPDGWVPHAQDPSDISLPPPHEFEHQYAERPPTSASRYSDRDRPPTSASRYSDRDRDRPQSVTSRYSDRERPPSMTSRYSDRDRQSRYSDQPPPSQYSEHPGSIHTYDRPPSAEPLMVPPRIAPYEEEEPMHSLANRWSGHSRRRRPGSPESDSTTFSQLDLIASPNSQSDADSTRLPGGRGRDRYASVAARRPAVGDRELSVIPEASPAHMLYRRPSLEPDYDNASKSTTPSPNERPLAPEVQIMPPENEIQRTPPARRRSQRSRTPQDFVSSPDSLAVPMSDYAGSQRSSSASIGIDVIPPSRPSSHASNRPGALTGLLSPQDVARTLPMILDDPQHAPHQSAPIPMPSFASPPSSGGVAIPAPGGPPDGLPRGFVPAGAGGSLSFSAMGPPSQAIPGLPNQTGPPSGWLPPSAAMPSPAGGLPPNFVPMGPPIPSPGPGAAPPLHNRQGGGPSYYSGYSAPSSYSRSRNASGKSSRRDDDLSSASSSPISSSLGTDEASLATPPGAPRTPLRALEDDLPLPPAQSAWAGSAREMARSPSVPPVNVRPPSAPPRPPSSAAGSATGGFIPPRPPSSAAGSATGGFIPPGAVGGRPPSVASLGRSGKTGRSTPQSVAGSLAGSERGNTPGPGSGSGVGVGRKGYTAGYASRLDSIAERPGQSQMGTRKAGSGVGSSRGSAVGAGAKKKKGKYGVGNESPSDED